MAVACIRWTRFRTDDLIANSVLDIGDGYRAKNSELGSSGLPFARAGNINDGFHFEDADILDEVSVARAGNKISRPGDIVFTSKGTVGRFAFVRPTTQPFVYSPQLCYWRVRNESIIDPRFLFYWMQGPEFTSQVYQVKGLTDMADYVNLRDQRQMNISLPPLPTQRKIAAILSAYDDLIENNTRRIRILEEMARALYREWFVHFRFPGHVPYEMVESPLGPIPEGWRVVRLGEIACEQRRGINPDAVDPNTPYFGLEHLPRRSIALSEWGAASEVQSTKLAFRKGEILFGKIRPYFHKVGAAPLDGVCSTDAIVIQPSAERYSSLVLACVSSDEFVRHATQTSQGTKMPRANWDVLTQYPVVLPPSPILFRFQELVQDMVNQIHNLIFRTRNLRQQRDLLLPKLVSGEVDVQGLEIEVAEV